MPLADLIQLVVWVQVRRNSIQLTDIKNRSSPREGCTNTPQQLGCFQDDCFLSDLLVPQFPHLEKALFFGSHALSTCYAPGLGPGPR